MTANTKIEWATHTFNPWVGCTKVSPACDHCYAESWAKRSGMVKWGASEPRRRTSDANWRQPLKWNAEAESTGTRPRVFCASLADVFDNAVPVQWRIDLVHMILETPNIDWLLLTKRIGNATEMLDVAFRAVHAQRERWAENVPSNVWIGATVVNQDEADRDIPKLLAVPAAKRFLSIEPLLGHVDLPFDRLREWNRLALLHQQPHAAARIDWVIVGGESGPGARPIHPDWARSIREQCVAAGVPFFFKQWGEWLHSSHDKQQHGGPLSSWQWDDGQPFTGKDGARNGMGLFKRVGKKSAGRMLDCRTWDEVPA